MRAESPVSAARKCAESRDPASVHREPDDSPSGVDSQTLLNGSREVIIRHAGQVYRLRHTQNDKLILTK